MKLRPRELGFWLEGPFWLPDKEPWPTKKSFVNQELRTDVFVRSGPRTLAASSIDPERYSTFDHHLRMTHQVYYLLRLDRSLEPYGIKYMLYSRLSEAITKSVETWSKDFSAALKENHFGYVPPYQAVFVQTSCKLTSSATGTSSDAPVLPGGRMWKLFDLFQKATTF